MTGYACFADLARNETEGKDFRVRCVDRPGSRAIILAPHGGEIESGTSDIAALVAGEEHSLFCFEGLKPYGENRGLHITSHRFDHPQCIAMTALRDVVVGVHGCMGEAQIFVGGLDAELANGLAIHLRKAGFTVISAGHRYPGRHPENICNRGATGRGAQLEITYDLRAPECRERIATAARAAVAERLRGA
jgi:phage replication-related protein YjqB (UPF0714/DUF867 family)